jgi:glutamate racemase
MATPLTLNQEKFNILYHRWNDAAEIELLPCPGLAKLIEEGHVADIEITNYLTALFSDMDRENTKAIVLGCTHYPIIKKEIKKHFPNAMIFDGGEGTARQTKRLLEGMNLLSNSPLGKITVKTSLDEQKTDEFKTKAMNLILSLNK